MAASGGRNKDWSTTETPADIAPRRSETAAADTALPEQSTTPPGRPDDRPNRCQDRKGRSDSAAWDRPADGLADRRGHRAEERAALPSHAANTRGRHRRYSSEPGRNR